MKVFHRPYGGSSDLQAMLDLAHTTARDNLHVIDLPYRLSSWAFDYPENIALWHDEVGKLWAWAVLQTPFWALDYYYLPDEPTLPSLILAWADEQARQLVNTPAGRPCWFVNVFTEQTVRIADLEQAGFANQAHVPDNAWSKVWMVNTSGPPMAASTLPPDFILRPLAGVAEAAAYVQLQQAVFQSKNMTVEWRRRTLARPEYRPELDLVVEAPNGDLAAFCIAWFDPHGFDNQPGGQIEPLGVHENYRSHGLGRVMLAESVRRLRGLGAQNVYVETDNYRNAALALYEAGGFRVSRAVLVYRKDYV